jgi:hypothetical protein
MQKASPIEQNKITATKSLSAKELQDARQVFNIFHLAWKNYGLYPEEHIASRKAFENLVAAFDVFFTTYGDLRLTVEKDRLLCGSDLIHEVSSDAPTEDIITLLYRDGIKWIEFQHGLTLEELASFFKIAYKYRLFVEETEGDIVTALMDEELEHIDFKAVDIFWQDLLLIDFSQLNTPPSQPEEATPQIETDLPHQPERPDQSDTYVMSIADPSRSDAQFEVSYDEYETLQQMVLEEENWDHTEDVFDVMVVILQSQTEPENFAAVLDFTFEEVVRTIEQGEFGLLPKLFQSLQKLLSQETSSDRAWIRPLIDRFFQDLHKPDILHRITEKLLKLQEGDTEKLKALHQVLLYFSPEIILFLVPVIMQSRSHEVQQMITEVTVHLSQSEIGPLEKISEQHGTELGEKLLVILNRLQGDRVNNIFFSMCEHPSDMVRRKAIKELVARDPKYAQKLFSLIDDPSKEIRSCIFAAVAKQRSTVLENMLLNYLRGNFAQNDPIHIRACYETLGRCGSNNAVPFLRRILLNQGWNSFIGSGKLVYREGAAIALELIDTLEAKDVLVKASKSKFKVIRKASHRTMAGNDISGENTND